MRGNVECAARTYVRIHVRVDSIMAIAIRYFCSRRERGANTRRASFIIYIDWLQTLLRRGKDPRCSYLAAKYAVAFYDDEERTPTRATTCFTDVIATPPYLFVRILF